MIALAFIVGGIAGAAGATGAAIFTDLSWLAILTVYFGIGFGLPLAVMAGASLIRRQPPALDCAKPVRR